MIGRVFYRLVRMVLGLLAPERVEKIVAHIAVDYARSLDDPADGLRVLFGIDDRLYRAEGKLAIQYGGGVHTKHKHMRYHDFFVERLQPGQTVLDFGCGRGELSYDMADRAGAILYAIDINERSVGWAQENRSHPNITFVHGDGLTDLPERHFDVLVMSNVLEHLDDRPAVLRRLVANHQPGCILIRVPSYQRDWRVPLKDELGLNYYLDPTHTIEYTQERFRGETTKAGLVIDELIAVWGELWVRLHPAEGSGAEG